MDDELAAVFSITCQTCCCRSWPAAGCCAVLSKDCNSAQSVLIKLACAIKAPLLQSWITVSGLIAQLIASLRHKLVSIAVVQAQGIWARWQLLISPSGSAFLSKLPSQISP